MGYSKIKDYLQTVRKIPVLAEIEERGLCLLLPALGAKNRLIEGYLWIIPQLAMRYRQPGIELTELIAVGNLALARAIKSYRGPGERQDLRAYIVGSVNHALWAAIKRIRHQERLKSALFRAY